MVLADSLFRPPITPFCSLLPSYPSYSLLPSYHLPILPSYHLPTLLSYHLLPPTCHPSPITHPHIRLASTILTCFIPFTSPSPPSHLFCNAPSFPTCKFSTRESRTYSTPLFKTFDFQKQNLFSHLTLLSFYNENVGINIFTIQFVQCNPFLFPLIHRHCRYDTLNYLLISRCHYVE